MANAQKYCNRNYFLNRSVFMASEMLPFVDRLLFVLLVSKTKLLPNCLSSLDFETVNGFPLSSHMSTVGSPFTFNFCPSGEFSGQ